jgi:hypothetical protein
MYYTKGYLCICFLCNITFIINYKIFVIVHVTAESAVRTLLQYVYYSAPVIKSCGPTYGEYSMFTRAALHCTVYSAATVDQFTVR